MLLVVVEEREAKECSEASYMCNGAMEWRCDCNTVTSKTVTMFGIFVVYIMQYLYVWEYRLALVRASDV